MVQRNRAYDIAKGAGIILVVFGHALIGVKKLLSDTAIDQWLLSWMYTFHMPLFFAISGVFSASLVKAAWPQFFKRTFFRIIYPYFLWSAILLTVHFFMSDFTNTVVLRLNYKSIFYNPPALMWFLYVLFFAYLVRKLTAPLAARARLAIAVLLFVMGCAELDIPKSGWLAYIGFFLLASELSPARMLQLAAHPITLIGSGAVFAATGVYAFTQSSNNEILFPAFSSVYIPAAFAGTALLLAVSALMDNDREAMFPHALAFIGERTMPIYVTHIFFTAGLRILLVRLGYQNGPVIVAAATVLGVAAPMMMYAAAERLKVTRLIGWKWKGA